MDSVFGANRPEFVRSELFEPSRWNGSINSFEPIWQK